MNWTIDSARQLDVNLYSIAYRVTGTRTNNGETFTTDITGTIEISYDDSIFTPFLDLSTDQKLQFIFENGVDQSSLEDQINVKLFELVSPPIIVSPLPTK
jgi:hypothetical protein